MSITEASNALTSNIDMADAHGIVCLLGQSDAQLFAGFSTHASLFDAHLLQQLLHFAKQQSELIGNGSGRIVFAGCGTSGRFAQFCSHAYNRVLSNLTTTTTRFEYLIAAGDCALVGAQELAEDKPEMGIADLQQVEQQQDAKNIIYVGITCGISAPYVAGQLYHAMQHKYKLNCLLGFNPLELARNVTIEGWQIDNAKTTFKQVLQQYVATEKNFVALNPVVGPEPITGSTRMKGGSATKIILDSCFGLAYRMATTTIANPLQTLIEILHQFETTYRYTYLHSRPISQLVQCAANSLQHGAHVYYLGYGKSGVLGFIDASEQTPTYGAQWNDVRGFLYGAWQTYGNKQAQEMEQQSSDMYKIGWNHFEQDIVLKEHDTVIGIWMEPEGDAQVYKEMVRLLQHAAKYTKHTAVIHVQQQSSSSSIMFGSETLATFVPSFDAHVTHMVSIPLPKTSILPQLNSFAEFAVKLVLNAITTGAHVLKGMTYGNRMINLRMSNNKLYFRAIQIVQHVMQVTEQQATECIQRAIYRNQYNANQVPLHSVESHIQQATGQNLIVPMALLMAHDSTMTWQQALQVLSMQPIVRLAIASAKK